MAPEQEIWAALARIIDPCSRFNGTCLDLVEMGLVREVLIDGGTVHVRLLLTDPSCVFTFEIIREIR
jgi:metal-sulfur cluster biosynthetic enzyme